MVRDRGEERRRKWKGEKVTIKEEGRKVDIHNWRGKTKGMRNRKKKER